MSIFTDYFIAHREQITDELVRDGPQGHLANSDLLPANNVDPYVVLAQLGEQLTGIPFLEIGQETNSWCSLDDSMPDDPDDVLEFLDKHGGGATVLELRDELRDALTTIGTDDLMSVAQRWMTVEEWAGSVTPQEIVPFLEKLASLARRAVANQQRLYCWWSL